VASALGSREGEVGGDGRGLSPSSPRRQRPVTAVDLLLLAGAGAVRVRETEGRRLGLGTWKRGGMAACTCSRGEWRRSSERGEVSAAAVVGARRARRRSSGRGEARETTKDQASGEGKKEVVHSAYVEEFSGARPHMRHEIRNLVAHVTHMRHKIFLFWTNTAKFLYLTQNAY
jgi:hypothetical protein